MQDLFFWRRWPSPERALYTILLIFTATLIIANLVLNLIGPEALIGWETYAQAETLPLVTGPVHYDLLNLTIEVDSQIFWQFFTGGEEIVKPWIYHLYLALISLGIVTLASAITYLKKFWYFVGVSLLIAGIASLDFELLYIMGMDNKVPMGVILALFVPATYYFNKINPDSKFITRWLYFGVVTVLIAVVIGTLSESSLPFMTLATSSVYLSMILSMIFVLMVGHEILVGILTLLTSNQGGALRHFLLFCGIYLLYILFTYLHEVSIISWDMVYINIILLLCISAVIGVWGFKKRETQYSYLVDFGPAGAFFYAGMMLIAMATLFHLEFTMNDPGIEVFRDFTIMGHLAFGVIFLAYILANFASPLGAGLAVHKIMFQPNTMPYFTFRLAGIIMFVGLLFPSGTKTSYFQTESARLNTLGDLAMAENEPIFALTYYEEGALYGYNNHKSNYSLGKYHISLGAYDLAITPLKRAIQKWPTPQSIVDLSRVYLETNQPYEALFALRNGIDLFPDNYELLNNAGLAYNEINVLDTAFAFLNDSHNVDPERTMAGANITGMFVKNEISYSPDSIVSLYTDEENPLSLVNGYLLKNLFESYWDRTQNRYDSVLGFMDNAVVFQQTLNHLYAADTFETHSLNKYLAHPANTRFREQLELGQILHLYRNSEVNRAFRKINSLANWSQDMGHKFYEIGGKWAMEQRAPRAAYDYFNWASQRQPLGSKLLLALSASEARLPGATELWEAVSTSEVPTEVETANFMLETYDLSKDNLNRADDSHKYAYLRFVETPTDTLSFLKTWNSLSNDDLKAQAIIYACYDLIETGRLKMAVSMIEKIEGLELTKPSLLADIKWLELELLAAQKNISLLAQQLNDGIEFDPTHEAHKQYFTGLIKAASNDPTARENLYLAAKMNPFYEDAVIASVNYISAIDKFEAYDLLVSALDVNPYSVPLLKSYILQCARVQLNNYADLSLESLRGLVSSQEFQAFYSQYVVLVQQVEAEENEF